MQLSAEQRERMIRELVNVVLVGFRSNLEQVEIFNHELRTDTTDEELIKLHAVYFPARYLLGTP